MNPSSPIPDPQTARFLEECRRDWPSAPDSARVVLGFDGFLDRVREMVANRESPTSYQPIRTLKDVEERLHDSTQSNSSCTFEWTRRTLRTGGHTVNVGRALRAQNYDLTLIGTFGQPPMEPFREEFPGAELVSIEEPGRTDAVEFDDGKLLLADTGGIPQLDWDTILDRVPVDRWVEHLDGADVLGMGYWSILPALPTILKGLLETVWPRCSSPPSTVLMDPADVRQVPGDRIQEGIHALREFSDRARVIVSANRTETRRLAALDDRDDGRKDTPMNAARKARRALGVSVFVCHGMDGAVWVDPRQTAQIQTPTTREPELTTGAGDVFAAGLIAGQTQGLSPGASLILGSAMAGEFVREGRPPDPDRLRRHLRRFESLFEESGGHESEGMKE